MKILFLAASPHALALMEKKDTLWRLHFLIFFVSLYHYNKIVIQLCILPVSEIYNYLLLFR